MSHIIPLSAVEIEARLKKIPKLAVDIFCETSKIESDGDIKYITLEIAEDPSISGLEVKFKSPTTCTATSTTRLHIEQAGTAISKVFTFADANGNDVGEIDNLFAENAVVKVILDLSTQTELPDGVDGIAFVQNADTNKYLEGRFADVDAQVVNINKSVVAISEQFTPISQSIEEIKKESVDMRDYIDNELNDINEYIEQQIANKAIVQIITWEAND